MAPSLSYDGPGMPEPDGSVFPAVTDTSGSVIASVTETSPGPFGCSGRLGKTPGVLAAHLPPLVGETGSTV